MHILHYTLGFQPYRSGGLVRYAADLMQMQASMGHKILPCTQEVCLLQCPSVIFGRMNPLVTYVSLS